MARRSSRPIQPPLLTSPASKRCRKCGEVKPLDDFYRHPRTKDRKQSYCKRCCCETANAWNRAHPEQKSATRRKTRYGLSPEQYAEMLELQAGCCSICGKAEVAVDRRTGKVKGLHVDHDHQTGQVRGLLCQKCNHMIGLAHEDTAVLLSAVAYLESWGRSKQWEEGDEDERRGDERGAA